MGGAAVPALRRTRTDAAGDLHPADLQAGADLYAQNCAACHGADGNGGIGANLHSIHNTTSLRETVALIENPIGAVMPRLYPSTLTDAQVQQIAAYVRATFR